MTRQQSSLFVRLVTYRYSRGGMIINTNNRIQDLPYLLAKDEIRVTSILDSQPHPSHFLSINGRSYWQLDLEDALKA